MRVWQMGFRSEKAGENMFREQEKAKIPAIRVFGKRHKGVRGA
jgi:hypothetical protein